MADEELTSYHALSVRHGGDYQKLKKLFDAHGFWEKAWHNEATHEEKERENGWKKLGAAGVLLHLSGDEKFPPLLREIPWPPSALYFRGAFPKNEEVCVAVVGTRKATSQGILFARKVGRELAEAGLVVVSGLALGIDAAAHKGALEGSGKTIAVLAQGLDQIYPRQNEALGREILAHGGALISEYPIGSPSYPGRFLERNRIVSGLCRGVVVIEAGERSGALATARFGLEQNREIFVVPGPVTHPNYAGSHALIKSGAMLITDTSDVLTALNIVPAHQDKEGLRENLLASLDEVERAVITMLHHAPHGLTMDGLLVGGASDLSALQRAVTDLTLANHIEERGGKFFVSH